MWSYSTSKMGSDQSSPSEYCSLFDVNTWSVSVEKERHCSEVAFRQAKLKAANPNPNPPNPSAMPPVTAAATGAIGYAPDAAWLAVRRHMQANSFDDLMVRVIFSLCQWSSLSISRSEERKVHWRRVFDWRLLWFYETLLDTHRLANSKSIDWIRLNHMGPSRNLRQYEQLMANLALEASEASQTLSSCLFELYNWSSCISLRFVQFVNAVCACMDMTAVLFSLSLCSSCHIMFWSVSLLLFF